MPINLPIALTWLRIAMIPLVVGLFYIPDQWLSVPVRDTIAATAFVVAALTDWFDGWLARRWNQTSSFGAFLDPVADKLMVCAALLVLLDLNRVDTFVALIIIGREITISALREWMAKIGAVWRCIAWGNSKPRPKWSPYRVCCIGSLCTGCLADCWAKSLSSWLQY